MVRGDIIKFVDELRNEPILLAHHPLCGKFDDHMLNIKARKVCRGCVTVYPTAILVLILFLLVRPGFEPSFIMALVLFGIQLIRFVSSGHKTAITFNMVLGSCLAITVFSVITCPSDLRIFLYPFIIVVAVIFIYLKSRRMFSRCHNCSNYGSFPECVRGSDDVRNRK
ncbi:MAG: hypothetical protein LUQ09_06775 [Methanomassiliicoccales archaeon]|nr:hypothetical protein [Methanomassiliicoccales archaeon]